VPGFTRIIQSHPVEFVDLLFKYWNLFEFLLPDMVKMPFFKYFINCKHSEWGTLLCIALFFDNTEAVKALLSHSDIKLDLTDWDQVVFMLVNPDYILELLKLEGEKAKNMLYRIYNAACVRIDFGSDTCRYAQIVSHIEVQFPDIKTGV
jgi:hypothetical protein